MIDLDTLIPGSKRFTWREVLWCPKWGVYVYPTPTQHSNLIKLASKMDLIRERLGVPLKITSGLRPTKYNEWTGDYGVGGAKASAHCEGKAMDVVPIGMGLEEARELVLSVLEPYGLRMEQPDFTPTWMHFDIRNVLPGTNRVFKP